MVTYEILNRLKKNENYKQLVCFGILPIAIVNKIHIYEFYLNECKTNDRVVAIQSTAENNKVSVGWVYKVISFMEK